MKAEVTDMRCQQAAGAVLMVRPSVFHSNPQTAATNLLQQADTSVDANHLDAARREFDAVVDLLTRKGIDVVAVNAPPGPPLPDAIFPNNWISTHDDGTVVLYPMLAPNRRLERQPALIKALDQRFGFTVRRIIDLTRLEEQGEIVEGTGSLVLDRVHRIAYVGLSPRATIRAVREACHALGYRECLFVATHASGAAIYHTNVMLSVGSEIAIGCFDTLRNEQQRKMVIEQLETTGKQVVSITESQMMEFGANVLELRMASGGLLAVSERAWAALDVTQKRIIEARLDVQPVAVSTIEHVGGGGLRCLLAEVHLPVRPKLQHEAVLREAQHVRDTTRQNAQRGLAEMENTES